ncbi:MAG: HAMP domain-containing histidine kinase [Oscillospiraceae bacterium]|jgi:signal transduction histidine kinase|nr:HAMP domain-containing histidine kinase [Oscillospiraceae bacterium]
MSNKIKKELRRLRLQLDEIINTDTNIQLTTSISDKDVAELVLSINNILSKNRSDFIKKERAEVALKRTITNISHDLRTPLTAALGYMQMMNCVDTDDITKARYAESIHHRLGSLSVLLNNLFDFSHIMEGNTVYDIQRIDIGNELYNVLFGYYDTFESGGFTVKINIPDKPIFCECDLDAFHRVLHNLLDNVCIHGKDYLLIRLRNKTIEIANAVNNLAQLDTDQLFDRFYMVDAARTGKNTGLGLAISKLLIEHMGGTITASIEDDLLFIKLKMKG